MDAIAEDKARAVAILQERRLKREGWWRRAPTDKAHWVQHGYGDDFTVAQYECFLNRCPVDDVACST